MLDAIIIGGGPAGLSAALVLGRCRRAVLVIDSGRGRNRFAREMHGYLTRDGIEPAALREFAHEELRRYRVEVRSAEVEWAEPDPDARFTVCIKGGQTLRCRKLLLATGMSDILPKIAGIESLYGTSVHHCPYCDAWEHRDQRLVAYGIGRAAVGLAMSLRTWSDRVTACTDGQNPEPPVLEAARRNAIDLRTERVVGLEGEEGRLRRIHFEHGPSLDADALFFNTGQVQRSSLPARLGCRFKDDGGVVTNNRQCTDVPGLYLAGDADREVQFVIVAAAEGATAATAINRELQDEERGSLP